MPSRARPSLLAALAVATFLAVPAIAPAEGVVPAAADRLLVRFDPDADRLDRSAAAATVEGVVTAGPVPGIRVVDLPFGSDAVAAAAALTTDPAVAWAQPDWIVRASRTPNDPYFPSTWGMTRVDAPSAWDVSIGAGVTVAVVDSGVDASHPDLAAAVAPGWDWVGDDADPSDEHGHGTHVAGIVAAGGDDGVGVAGMAWGSRVMALRVLDANGMGFSSDIAAAFDHAGNQGVRVVNASLGGAGRDLATEAAIARHPETLYVLAAGNAGTDNDAAPVYPCAYPLPNVVCVAATTESDDLAGFSNIGATTVHLAAPGSAIVSTYPAGGWATMSGTSMAAPHVAGAAALVLAQRPDLSAAGVRAALLDSADRLPALVGRTVSGGRLNVARALALTARGPSARTGDATVAADTARLTGSVDGRGQASAWSVEYGATTAYGRTTAPENVDGSARTVAATLAGLAPGTYPWRLRVTSADGTAVGADGSFVTVPAAAPAVNTVRSSPAVLRRTAAARIAEPRCAAARRVPCRRFRASVAAWTTLRGLVDRPEAGSAVATVQVNVVRRDGARCRVYDGRRFRPTACGRSGQVWVAARRVGHTWRLKVSGLQPGAHVFRVRALGTGLDAQRVGDVDRRAVRLH
jgi:subtilisin family serine protease